MSIPSGFERSKHPFWPFRWPWAVTKIQSTLGQAKINLCWVVTLCYPVNETPCQPALLVLGWLVKIRAHPDDYWARKHVRKSAIGWHVEASVKPNFNQQMVSVIGIFCLCWVVFFSFGWDSVQTAVVWNIKNLCQACQETDSVAVLIFHGFHCPTMSRSSGVREPHIFRKRVRTTLLV